MIEDKIRWNKRFVDMPQPQHPTAILERHLNVANKGQALDIACGLGRNTHFLADNGFKVDALDFSDYALSQLKDSQNIDKIEVDLDSYILEKNRYDLIINANFLNRRFFPQIKEALKKDGVLFFETFIIAHGDFDNPKNPEYLLRKNELLHAFIGLDIIYYEERDGVNILGEKTRVASLVAQKS
jgi:SAM-dependent methyltransferase